MCHTDRSPPQQSCPVAAVEINVAVGLAGPGVEPYRRDAGPSGLDGASPFGSVGRCDGGRAGVVTRAACEGMGWSGVVGTGAWVMVAGI